jgi:hypothetical protein
MTQSDRASLLWKGSPASDREIDQLLHPSRFYTRPSDVLADHLLTVEERRAILSSWASDACGVESNPALRQPPHASEPVTFDEIMDALLQLDRLPSQDTESRRRRQNARAGVNPPAYPSSSLSRDIKKRFVIGHPGAGGHRLYAEEYQQRLVFVRRSSIASRRTGTE